ncbi:hypothetical protein GCM10023311_14770 [Flaviramulus aquimarinus]|uniref:SGNH/GDSL hydrolase family protein n=1 Tax=Flaviramulus aquimarinus TaxID=1170456 RepID=A0ABP9F7F1_9FLAO
MKNVFIVCLLSIFLNSCNAQKSIKYAGIDRTLSLLQNSTKESPNNVDILFYGQSIIGGMKTNILVDSLRNLYPNTNITYKHKPIGGFTIPRLIKTAEHDIFHENPDLIVFHAYDGIKDGLYDSLIKKIRSKMTSDVLLLNHHYVWNVPESKLKHINKSHDFDSKEIQKISKKYDCGFVDVRKQWAEYLNNRSIGANELMGNTIDPNVHPNDKGNALLRSIVLKEFKKRPNFEYNEEKDEIRNSQKEINTSFFGTRVDLITIEELNSGAKIKVLVDGKRPSTFKSNYYISRPSKGFKSWMPAMLNVSLGATFPVEEKWTLEIYDINREEENFKFKLYGSLTGFDGDGDLTTDFISNSNRIIINSEDFMLFQIEEITKKNIPEGFKIEFSVISLVKDIIELNNKESKYTLFRGLQAKNHDLSLEVISGSPSIKELLISQPFLEANE